MSAKRFTLWGFHPAYRGKDGHPYPLPLMVGTQRECNGERARRLRQSAEWVTGTYRTGTPPTGLRMQCTERYPNRSQIGES